MNTTKQFDRMNTKSSIQLVLEEENIKNQFKHNLSEIVESYTVKGNVFTLAYGRHPVEVSNGYFVEEKIFDNLNDCINEMSINQAISINEDKYILGSVKKHLSECEGDKKVLDIQYLQYVR